MARTDRSHPKTGPRDHPKRGGPAAPQGDVLPSFFVDSAGVATPGRMLRGEGFTMRDPARDGGSARRRGESLH